MADRGTILHRIVLWNILLVFVVCHASPQSNYANRGFDVEYQGNGIPQEAVLDGVVTKLDELSHIITTNRTIASLSCASRAMEVDLEFAEPFHGIVYADFNRHSACSFVGNGELKYHYELPLTGCGTLQDPLRVFTNNLIVRFHPSLELDGDEVKTIVCRYPEPIVPPPLGPPLPISVAEKPPLESKPEGLGELQILLIICALLFLALMLFGVACSYFCLKQRNIKLIRRRRALSSAPGSVVTKMSESSLQLPMFDGLKIPRAHPPSNPGSDQQLIIDGPMEPSDTLPSDYPSESRSSSEIEEGDTRSMRRPSTVSSICQEEPPPIQHVPLVHREDDRLSSVYSDAPPQSEFDMVGAPTAVPRVEPSFDVAFRVTPLKRKSPSPPSSVTSDDSRVASMRAQERTLSTILEKEEWRQAELRDKAKELPIPDLNQPAIAECPPPASYARVKRRPRSVLSQRSIPENDTWSVTEHEEVPDGRRKPPEASFRVKHRQPSEPREPSESTESTRTLMLNDDVDLHTSTFHHIREDEEAETMIVPTSERPIPPPKLQEVDDVYLKTITEKRIIEENERLRRNVLEYHQRPALPPNWDVTIRKHPPVYEPRTPSESTMPDWDVQIRQYPPAQEPREPSESTDWDAASQIPPNWDVKIRQYPPLQEPREPSESTDWDAASQIPPNWDVKIRQYPPLQEPREPSETTDWDTTSQVTAPQPPDWNVAIRQYPPIMEPRTPSESTDWDGLSQAEPPVRPPDWNVAIRQYPPLQEPREPSESTDWDTASQIPPDWDVKIRQYPPVQEPREPSESTDWDRMSQPTLPPDWNVKIRQYPPTAEPRTPSEAPDWDVKIRQYPPVHEPRTPSELTDWDRMSQPPPVPPDWDVKIRQYPPVHEPRTPSESTDWDGMSQPRELPPDWDVKIRQYPPAREPRTPSDSTDWDRMSQPPALPPDWDVAIRQYPPVREPRTPSDAEAPDWDVKIRQYPPVHEPRTPSESTDWDRMSQPPAMPPDWDVAIRQYPPVHEPRTPSDSTDWDGMSQTERLRADDLYVKTVTEKHVTEEEEIVRRRYMEYRSGPPRPPNWDVTIRQHPPVYEPRPPSDSTDWDQTSDVGSERPVPRPPINWNVLIRVLNPPVDRDDVSSTLTIEDREKWHQIITTESTLRTMLTEAVVREDFERIRRDVRFERIFEPRKWDVIIRVLAPPTAPRDDRSDTMSESTVNSEPPVVRRFRKKSDADPRSKRSALAPVHEGAVYRPSSGPGSTRSSVKSADDVRSLTETTVNFGKYAPDTWSQSSGPRSVADRSHSEISERHAYPREDWDDADSERMSRPSLARSTSEFTEANWTTRRVPFDRMSSGSGYSSSSNRKLVVGEDGREPSSSPADGVSDGSMEGSSPRQFRRRVPYERVSSSSSESEPATRPQ